MDRFNGPSCALRPSRVSFILSQRFGYVGIESQHAQIETLIYFGDDAAHPRIARPSAGGNGTHLFQPGVTRRARADRIRLLGAALPCASQLTNLK
jgi:hypothetical protein